MTQPASVRQQRLDRYEKRSALPMVILALTYIVLFAVEVLATGLSAGALHALTIVSNAIWIVFVADLAWRTFLTPRRGRTCSRTPST